MNKYILLLCIAVAFFSSCENDLETVRKFDYYEEIPTEIARNVEMMYSDSFQVRVIVKSPKLIRYGGVSARDEFKGGIEVDFIGKELRATSKLTAKEAVKKNISVKDKKNRVKRESVVIVRDSVILKSGNGDVMKTDELIWYENADKLSTTKQVRIKTKNKDIFGFGFESDKDFKNWKIHSVIGEFKSDALIKE